MFLAIKTLSVVTVFSIILSSVLFLADQRVQEKLTPSDFSAIDDVDKRKQKFINFLLPIINEINQRIAHEREILKRIYADLDAGKIIAKKSRVKLMAWAEQYRVDFLEDDLLSTAKELLLHLDQIPASMVLAQAANESGWGRSRFAVEGNNYFGQWCFEKGCGIVPRNRPDGAYHEVRKFDNVKESIEAYFININSHRSYKYLRKIRSNAREKGEPLSGLKMIEGLKNYSQRGKKYIKDLRRTILFNQLEEVQDK